VEKLKHHAGSYKPDQSGAAEKSDRITSPFSQLKQAIDRKRILSPKLNRPPFEGDESANLVILRRRCFLLGTKDHIISARSAPLELPIHVPISVVLRPDLP
jgi:hypothetical protein